MKAFHDSLEINNEFLQMNFNKKKAVLDIESTDNGSEKNGKRGLAMYVKHRGADTPSKGATSPRTSQ